MTRKVFYSFHYAADAWRAAKIRQIGAIEGNRPAQDNDWEAVTRAGDKAIENWIKGQMDARTCAIVLVGPETAGRKWINYEIIEAWNRGIGLFGIRIHRLLDHQLRPARPGANPFDEIFFTGTQKPLSSVVKLYDPPGPLSADAYKEISDNIDRWIETAIDQRS